MPNNAKDRADRQKKYYTKQRETAEESADEGDVKARATVSKINKKLGRTDRQYTDTDAVDKTALAVTAGPDAIGADAAIGAGKFALGKAISKFGSKGAEAVGNKVSEAVGKLTKREPKAGAKNVTPKASAAKPSPAKALLGRKALSGGKDAVKEAPKAGEPKALGPGKKTGAEMRKSATSRKMRAAKGTKGKDPIAVGAKRKAPAVKAASRGTRKAVTKPANASAKEAVKEKAAPKAEAPKKSLEEHADEAARKTAEKNRNDAKAKLKARLAAKGKLKKS